MALIELSLPLVAISRIVTAIERIANYCDRMNPPLENLAEPEPGLTVVTNTNIVEEQVRENLRSLGYKPDDVDAMIEAAKAEERSAS